MRGNRCELGAWPGRHGQCPDYTGDPRSPCPSSPTRAAISDCVLLHTRLAQATAMRSTSGDMASRLRRMSAIDRAGCTCRAWRIRFLASSIRRWVRAGSCITTSTPGTVTGRFGRRSCAHGPRSRARCGSPPARDTARHSRRVIRRLGAFKAAAVPPIGAQDRLRACRQRRRPNRSPARASGRPPSRDNRRLGRSISEVAWCPRITVHSPQRLPFSSTWPRLTTCAWRSSANGPRRTRTGSTTHPC
jgi:hypothetical protein